MFVTQVRYLTDIFVDYLRQNVRNFSQISLCLSQESHWALSKLSLMHYRHTSLIYLQTVEKLREEN